LPAAVHHIIGNAVGYDNPVIKMIAEKSVSTTNHLGPLQTLLGWQADSEFNGPKYKS
jgi:hypothetical protein